MIVKFKAMPLKIRDRERSSRRQHYKAYFLYGGGGYNSARGLISREITKFKTRKIIAKNNLSKTSTCIKFDVELYEYRSCITFSDNLIRTGFIYQILQAL